MHAAEAANYALIATIVLLAAHVVQLLIEKRRKRAPKVAKPTSQFLQDAAPVLIVFASVTVRGANAEVRLRLRVKRVDQGSRTGGRERGQAQYGCMCWSGHACMGMSRMCENPVGSS